MSWGVVAGIGGSLLIGGMQADAAGDAAGVQAGATREGIAENRRQFDKVQQLLEQYTTSGTAGLYGYKTLMGEYGPQYQQNRISQLQNGGEYKSLVRAGEEAILQNASATGGLRGGNVQGALANQRSNILSALIERQIGRYGNLIQLGQNSAAGVGTAAMTTGANNAALMQAGGAAQAGGIIAGSNAFTNALGGIGGLVAGRGGYGGGTVGGLQGAFSQTPVGSSGFGSGLAYGNQDLGAYF